MGTYKHWREVKFLSEEKKEVSRRKFLATSIGTLVVGAVAGYAGGYATAPGKVVEKVVEKPVEKVVYKPPPKRPVPKEPIKLAYRDHLSGALAVRGEWTKRAMELLVEETNKEGGILGREISLTFHDEAIPVEECVADFRRLGLEAKVDVIIGTTSSGVALAQAPVADEIKTIYIIPHAASYKVVMEPHKYVFRTNGHTGAVPIAMALYVLKKMPDVKRVAHIDMDYAWGRDNWNVFIATLKKYKPDVEVVAEVWEKVGEVDHSTAITKVLAAKPDIVFNSHWGGQLVSLVRQAIEYKFFEYTTFVCTVIEEAFPEIGPDFPEGQLGAPWTFYWEYPGYRWNLNRWFVKKFIEKYGVPPNYPCMQCAAAFFAYKTAVEKAYEVLGEYPTKEQIAETLAGLAYAHPGGMNRIRREDHQALAPPTVGVTKIDPKWNMAVLHDFEVISAELVYPPPFTEPLEWIKTW